MSDPIIQDRRHYVDAVLRLYFCLPETPQRAGRGDRQMASLLFKCGIDLQTLRQALLLGSIRRLARAPELPTLQRIRTLNYFVPLIGEVLENPLPGGYAEYLERKLESLAASIMRAKETRPAQVQKNTLSGDR